jgi:hypothetical protein
LCDRFPRRGAAAANWFLVVSVPACDVRRIAIICSM